MEISYTYYKYDGWYIGYLNDFPEYLTQGETITGLEEMLLSIYEDIKTDEIPFIRYNGKMNYSA